IVWERFKDITHNEDKDFEVIDYE
ncbi:MAG: hypothetical protein QG641_456, partial [Candidatus Poribacteria bacterium]|nr:hypothetical protein [Candidatus Poribacteria bacterium]